jgi:hypothetical protein
VGGTLDVIMAAYPAAELADRDFDALVRLARDKAVRSEGVIGTFARHRVDSGIETKSATSSSRAPR